MACGSYYNTQPTGIAGRISLREALGTPESVRTATPDRWTLGSDALSRVASSTSLKP